MGKEILYFYLADGSLKGAKASRHTLHKMQQYSRFFGVCSSFVAGYGSRVGIDESTIPVEEIPDCENSSDGEHHFHEDDDREECSYCEITRKQFDS